MKTYNDSKDQGRTFDQDKGFEKDKGKTSGGTTSQDKLRHPYESDEKIKR